MPLVKSTSDGAFVEEVRAEMEDHCRRKIEHTSAMIEEYLRLRERQFEDKIRHEVACQEEKTQRERDAQEQAKEKIIAQLSVAQERVARGVDVMGKWDSLRIRQCFFQHWLHFQKDRRVKREKGALYCLFLSRLTASRFFHEWRLFAVGRLEHHQQTRQKKQWNVREKELTRRIEELSRELEEEKHRNEELDVKLRESFLRGVSALNREAFQVLRGEEGEQGEDEVGVIEEILGRSLTKRSSAGMSPRQAGASQAEGPRGGEGLSASALQSASSGICSVHMLDKEKNFYHRCYAPSTCAYGPRKAANDSAPRTPFLVRVDSKQAPSYNAGQPTKSIPTRSTGRR